MTPEQLTLARQFAEAVGWPTHKDESGHGLVEWFEHPEHGMN